MKTLKTDDKASVSNKRKASDLFMSRAPSNHPLSITSLGTFKDRHWFVLAFKCGSQNL